MSELCFIVSDYYAEFAKSNRGVYTYTQFVSLLERKSPELNHKDFLIGQGMSEQTRVRLAARVRAVAPELRLIDDFPPLVDKQLVHKHKEENVIITRPVLVDHLKYSAQVVLNDQCAELRDHQTGQHIQGLVLMEAARQLVTASSDMILLKKGIKPGGALRALQGEYHHYAFPLRIDMECTFNKEPAFATTGVTVEAIVNHYQLNKLLSSLCFQMIFVDPKLMHYVELGKAEETLKNFRSIAARYRGAENGKVAKPASVSSPVDVIRFDRAVDL
jgi:hypothetical protein